MPINQTQPTVSGFAPGGSEQIVHPVVLVDTSDNASGIAGNPVVTRDNILAQIVAGQGYMVSTGQLNSATGTNNTPLCIFNASNSGKNILLYSLTCSSGTEGANTIAGYLQLVTVNPAYASTPTIINALAGGSASVATCSYTTTTQTLSGTFADVRYSTTAIEFLPGNSAILLPSGSAHGVTLFLQTYATGISALGARWIEY